MMNSDDPILRHVDVSRRLFIKRFVTGAAFAIPVVASFDMRTLSMSTADAQAPIGSP